jgi:hypothetical protein
MRNATGYFSGYICKRQPVGRFQLKAAARTLPLMQTKLASAKNISNQMAQVVSRMFSTLEGRGKLRTAAEEYNLAANHSDVSETFAEYISTFNTEMFNGFDLLNRLENEKCLPEAQPYVMLQARKRAHEASNTDAVWYNFSDIYGFRPPLECLLYLSPWEFVAWWTVLELLPPDDEKYTLTRWISPTTHQQAAEMQIAGETEDRSTDCKPCDPSNPNIFINISLYVCIICPCQIS